MVALILRDSGYIVITATSLAEAMRIASNGQRFDLLLMDDELPPSDADDLSDSFLEYHPEGVVLKLSQQRHAPDLFAGKTLVDFVADALRSRFGLLHGESALAGTLAA